MKHFLNTFILIMVLTMSAQGQNLESYLKIAAENNPGIQAKYKAFEASMERIQQVGALPDPNLSFGYFISPVETRVGPQRARFSLSQMFPWFGTLRAQEDVASLLAEAKYQEFLDAKNTLFRQVSEAYFPLQEMHEMIQIEKENGKILELYKKIATSKFENDEGSLADALRVDIMMQASDSQIQVLENQIKAQAAWFNSLLAREPDEMVEIEVNQSFANDVSISALDSIENNPLLNSLDLKIQASAASELVAQKQGMPKLGAGLDYVLVGEREDMIVQDNGKNAFMPMVTLSLPIFRGKYKGAQKEAQIMQEAYTLEKEEVSNKLYGSYYRFLTEMNIQEDLIDLYQNQAKTTKQTLELVYSAYGNSGKDFDEVLRIQQQLLEFERQEVKAKKAYKIARVQLDYLTSKSF